MIIIAGRNVAACHAIQVALGPLGPVRLVHNLVDLRVDFHRWQYQIDVIVLMNDMIGDDGTTTPQMAARIRAEGYDQLLILLDGKAPVRAELLAATVREAQS